jgi:hypothetical protein
MTASGSAIYTEFVLNGDDLDVIDVKVVCRAAIRIELLFVDLKTYSIGIVVPFRTIVDRSDNTSTTWKVRGDGLAQVGCESRDPTLPRKMIAYEGYVIDGGDNFHADLARPRLRPARCKDLKVALGAAPIGRSGLAVKALKSKTDCR